VSERYVPRLKVRYREEILPRLRQELGYANAMEVPRLQKVVINMGVGDALKDARMLEAATQDLAVITGQRPVVTKARKSIAGFKLREGMSIGAKVTLRGDRMWEFVDRLVDYTLGLTEQLIFPEVDYDKVVKVRGMDITVATTARTDDEGRALLIALGFPFEGAPAVSAAAS
jgi:large subunit ribosomal protein L5